MQLKDFPTGTNFGWQEARKQELKKDIKYCLLAFAGFALLVLLMLWFTS